LELTVSGDGRAAVRASPDDEQASSEMRINSDCDGEMRFRLFRALPVTLASEMRKRNEIEMKSKWATLKVPIVSMRMSLNLFNELCWFDELVMV
jgi:hypothetical protein